METRALAGRGARATRAWYAAALLVGLLAALLGAWFASGWHDVRLRQREVREAPRRAAEQRADEIGRDVRGQLEGLIAREVRRPYFHYQNLMHDPKASLGVSVSPSPLAHGPDDELVLGYFQIDAQGRATTPTINDDFPDLSEPDNLADNRAFRDQVVRDLVRELAPPAAPALVADSRPVAVADAVPATRPRSHPRPEPAASSPPPSATPQGPAQQAQVIQLDPDVYVQNSNSNMVYWRQLENNAQPTPKEHAAPVIEQPASTEKPVTPKLPEPVTPKPVARDQAPRKTVEPTPPVTITISPLEWHTLAFAGGPALVAVRNVQTPDGSFAQGFVVDRSALTTALAAKAGEMVAELRPQADDEPAAAAHADSALARHSFDVAPGWRLTVEPNPMTLARAATSAADIARTFLVRFSVVGAIALVVAGFVLLLVLRAEQLARERSQFAAAAAHELRTPLAGLQLYGDMLADGLGDPGKVRDYARRMSEEASRLGRVVSNVLGFSQLERGNLSVDAQVGSLGVALAELAERAEPALDRAGAALELDVSPDLRARFDRDALARIVGNLLDNAEKYARGAEDRTIRLAAREHGETVEVTVADKGPGVADRAALFRAFARGVSADGPAGLGLGLALSRSLARAMGGDLAYRSGEGEGATFVLELPRA
ncbi:MAG TPA: HAMP domain-containing sensor histidine kinase [Kofleriaceae bacterium]|nr:HAMP domain-containing sensor histidine kinase [Kofleriaceae bacterium]